ncbi:hypothetical protein CC_2875 [Caulobacter vibrioides CB15]|uniref:Uncharacterized protein n=1 Tax=Caulobacter vibrioides (strain ATCC 19089 / CIP 103742 / CB 15) TaxID=190650 RepID=Q9A4F9_CAUVC|nr:hypothetical protein CC_2875 [Caulobacter vibrioides CB15]ATC29709.1 hypothetical protein CA607_15495 [Caulobacter vibrioides]
MSGVLAQQHPANVALAPRQGDQQIDRQEQHPAEHRQHAQAQGGGAEAATPRHPQAREQQKAEEVEVELPRPAHGRHVAEEDRDEVPAVVGDGDAGIADDDDQTGQQEQAKRDHRTVSFGGVVRRASRNRQRAVMANRPIEPLASTASIQGIGRIPTARARGSSSAVAVPAASRRSHQICAPHGPRRCSFQKPSGPALATTSTVRARKITDRVAGIIQLRGPSLGCSAMMRKAASKPRAAPAGRMAYTDWGMRTSCSVRYITSVL